MAKPKRELQLEALKDAIDSIVCDFPEGKTWRDRS